MNKILVGVVVVVVIVLAVVFGRGDSEKKSEEAMMSKTPMESAMKNDAMMKKGNEVLDFSKAEYDLALKTDKLVVLYFYANWCPICIVEFPIMQSAFREFSSDKVIGFKVNYNDNQTDADEKNLAKEFGVAYQHTKVFIQNGQRILKSPEGWDAKRYDMEINQAIKQ